MQDAINVKMWLVCDYQWSYFRHFIPYQNMYDSYLEMWYVIMMCLGVAL